MKKFTIYFIALLLFQVSAFAGTNYLIKKAGTSKEYPQADYLVVLDETFVDVQETGLSYNNIHKIYKVLNAQGAKELSKLIFDYDPLSAFVEIKEVKIFRSSGAVDLIGQDRVYDYPAPARAIYWGARQKMVDIGRLEPGDGIEVSLFRKGFTYALLFDQDQPDETTTHR